MADQFVTWRNDYNRKHYDRFSLMLEAGEKERLQAWAKVHGISSLNKLIKMAIIEYMERREKDGNE